MQESKKLKASIPSAVLENPGISDDVFYKMVSVQNLPGLIIVNQTIAVQAKNESCYNCLRTAVSMYNKSSSSGMFTIRENNPDTMLITYTQKIISKTIQNKSFLNCEMVLEQGVTSIKGLLFDTGIQMGEVVDVGKC